MDPPPQRDPVASVVAVERRMLACAALTLLAVHGVFLLSGQYALSALLAVAGICAVLMAGRHSMRPMHTELRYGDRVLAFIRAEGRNEPVFRGLRKVVEGLAARAGIPVPSVSLFTTDEGPDACVHAEAPNGHVVVSPKVVLLGPDVVRAAVAHEIGHLVIRRSSSIDRAAMLTALVAWHGKFAFFAVLLLFASAQQDVLPYVVANVAVIVGTTIMHAVLTTHSQVYYWTMEYAADELAARYVGSSLQVALTLTLLCVADGEDGDASGFTHPSTRLRVERLARIAIDNPSSA